MQLKRKAEENFPLKIEKLPKKANPSVGVDEARPQKSLGTVGYVSKHDPVALVASIEADVSRLVSTSQEVFELDKRLKEVTRENALLEEKLVEFEAVSLRKDCEIRDLHHRLAATEDDKRLSLVSPRTQEINDLKKSLKNYKEENSRLQVIHGNFLLLNEQYESLRDVITRQERVIKEYKSWATISTDKPCPDLVVAQARDPVLQENNEKLSYECQNLQNQLAACRSRLCELEKENIDLKETANSLMEKAKFEENMRKMSEKALERTSHVKKMYSDILESYESLPISESSIATLLKERCKKLEKTLDEMVKSESTASQRRSPRAREIPASTATDSSSSLKKGHSPVRACVRTDVLQGEANNHRIIHLSGNPLEKFKKTALEELTEALNENSRLNLIVKSLVNDYNKNSVVRLPEVLVNALKELPSAKQLRDVKNESEKNKKLAARMKQACTEKIHSFRSDCTKLFGYGIEYCGEDNTIRLTSVYSERPEDMLIFKRLNNGKLLQLVENEFTKKMRRTIVLNSDLSLLASAITLELFSNVTKS